MGRGGSPVAEQVQPRRAKTRCPTEFSSAPPFFSLAEPDVERWGESNHGSQALTGASARLLGIGGYQCLESSNDEQRIARSMLGDIGRDARGSRTALYSGHSMNDERLGLFKPGAVVTLPLTACSVDRHEARQFTVGEPGRRGSHDVLLQFERGTPNLGYGRDAHGDTLERITAGAFSVTDLLATVDDYWGTMLTVITLKSASAASDKLAA